MGTVDKVMCGCYGHSFFCDAAFAIDWLPKGRTGEPGRRARGGPGPGVHVGGGAPALL